MRRWGWVAVLLVITGIVYFGCSQTSDPGGNGDIEYNRETEDNLLKFFANAYEEKEIDDYEDSLDDAFLFQFTPDIADTLGLPVDEPWWGKTQDVGSTQKMFNATEVLDIFMEYRKVTQWVPIDEPRPDTVFYGLFIRLEPDIKVVIDEGLEEPTTYHVRDSWLDVTAVPDRKNKDEWTILKIQEISKK